jgi:hypothetical protein
MTLRPFGYEPNGWHHSRKTLAQWLCLENAIVVEISYEKAKELILKYEWLRNMGSTERSFGLILDGELAGVCCFGATGGTGTVKSVAGEGWAQYVVTLCRGACAHWAHPHSASYLISRACKLMANSRRITKSGKEFPPAYIFVAYADGDAPGEIGTVYQACNWLYCGKTSGTTMYRDVTGKLRDSKLIHSATRSRRGRSARPDETGRANCHPQYRRINRRNGDCRYETKAKNWSCNWVTLATSLLICLDPFFLSSRLSHRRSI